jgi:hypothetical protein
VAVEVAAARSTRSTECGLRVCVCMRDGCCKGHCCVLAGVCVCAARTVGKAARRGGRHALCNTA